MSEHEQPDPGGPDAEEFSALLVGIQRLIRRQLRAGLEQPRLRGAQVELLRLVADSPGLRVSDAAAELFLAGNSVSTLVNQLVGQGLLRRETDPADRRAALLYVTEEAVERLAAWRARRTALVGEVAAELPPAQRAALVAALPALRAVAAGLRARAGGDASAEAGEGSVAS
ncbi:MarR family winged helix-turn-helix transcriptional regulator [Streptomyces sp. TLI_171]|uniref:MarR family winged helix-turn-helix transcriptional regulator n=1 Tax=Streptomyces sp. TLI_171 TaxID=1938859 RepID=UPI000C17E907|nr:MarR family transcriptional regulator [Streptomyces sp. TLI_171]RKE17897.1 DNA-binding MarR family transcriptional regulator [Streptomyces sp. TLI_171]